MTTPSGTPAPQPPTTYRVGVYVVDTGRGRVGRVMDNTGRYLQLRPPGGGREWDCPPVRARLATEKERRNAGVVAQDTPKGTAT
ncbi:hypothetical protein ACWGJ2_04175 [Streptomyces sp. NPDC054796]